MVEEFNRNRKDLKKRAFYLLQKAKDNHIQFGWESMTTHHTIYITNEAEERIWEEIILSQGVPIVEKIHCFLDVIERQMENYK